MFDTLMHILYVPHLMKITLKVISLIWAKILQQKSKNILFNGVQAQSQKGLIINVKFLIFFVRISFIGHSLGGLIIRASLPYLKEYKDQFYTYLTLSTPHLGLIYGNSSLVDAGW